MFPALLSWHSTSRVKICQWLELWYSMWLQVIPVCLDPFRYNISTRLWSWILGNQVSLWGSLPQVGVYTCSSSSCYFWQVILLIQSGLSLTKKSNTIYFPVLSYTPYLSPDSVSDWSSDTSHYLFIKRLKFLTAWWSHRRGALLPSAG